MISYYLTTRNIVLVTIITIMAYLLIFSIEVFQPKGKIPTSVTEELKPILIQFSKAINTKNTTVIFKLKSEMINTLGEYAGVPEVDPDYVLYGNINEPDINKVIAVWREANKANEITRPWVYAEKNSGYAGTKAPRLRKSLRQALGELRSAELDLLGENGHLKVATRAFDYMIKTQSPNGVFGFPVGNDSKGNVGKIVKRKIREANQLGKNILWNDWIIDDLGSGDLKFDNGVVGAGLIYAYWMTNNQDYLKSAQASAEWAMKQPYSPNFNYNSFSGYLLARLYRATDNKDYLKAAEDIFDYAVLPGQMENGRWFDPHNARIQYHSVMMRALIEYYLALKYADSDKAIGVKSAIIKGLDNLAEEIINLGVSNAHEMLSLDALVLGLLAIDDKPLWQKAVNANVNYLLDGYWKKLLKHNRPIPNGVATYILYRHHKVIEVKGYEYNLQLPKKSQKNDVN